MAASRISSSVFRYLRRAHSEHGRSKSTVISAPGGKIDEPVKENLVAKISVSQSPSNLVNSFLFLLFLRRDKIKNLSPCERFFLQGLLKDRIKRREMGGFAFRGCSSFRAQVTSYARL